MLIMEEKKRKVEAGRNLERLQTTEIINKHPGHGRKILTEEWEILMKSREAFLRAMEERDKMKAQN